MSNFTCINCNVKFADADTQKLHYKTDWHRYNLKRKISQLGPVTSEEFQKRVLESRAILSNNQAELNTTFYCNACRKQFQNQKAFDNHENSKKHKENLRSSNTIEEEVLTKSERKIKERPKHALEIEEEDEMDVDEDEDDEDWEDEEIDEFAEDKEEERNPIVEDCLFCDHKSENIVKNMEHMSVVHTFFIPDMEFCIDLPNLVVYLAEKVKKYFICLFCNDEGKAFYSLDAVRKHMNDKGHCMINHEGINMAEYSDFYDYSSSYPDNGEANDIDEEIDDELLDGNEYQLVLPNGNTIGHRSLNRYYKQHLNPNRQLVPKKNKKLTRIMNQYRSIGWKPATSAQLEEKKMRIKQAKYQMRLGVKANKLQHHYREQVMF